MGLADTAATWLRLGICPGHRAGLPKLRGRFAAGMAQMGQVPIAPE
jgi:hypothetical protein